MLPRKVHNKAVGWAHLLWNALAQSNTNRHCNLLYLCTGWGGFTVPEAAIKGCTYPEFDYALQALHNTQRAKHAQHAKQSKQLERHNKQQDEAELRSAFTREEAAAGCADIDDEGHGDTGQQQLANPPS